MRLRSLPALLAALAAATADPAAAQDGCVDGTPAYRFAVYQCADGDAVTEAQCEALATFLGFTFKKRKRNTAKLPGGCFAKWSKQMLYYSAGNTPGTGCNNKLRCVCDNSDDSSLSPTTTDFPSVAPSASPSVLDPWSHCDCPPQASGLYANWDCSGYLKCHPGQEPVLETCADGTLFKTTGYGTGQCDYNNDSYPGCVPGCSSGFPFEE